MPNTSLPPGKLSHNGTFLSLLALVVWLPLPFGSGTLWARSIIEIWVYLLAIFFLFGCIRSRQLVVPIALIHSWPFLSLLALLIAWMGLQQIPLPPAIVDWFSPRTAGIWEAAPGISETDWIPLTLDRYATMRDMRTTCSFLTLVMLILLLVNSTQRLRQMVGAIIVAGGIQAAWGSLMTLSGKEIGFFVNKDFHIGSASGTFLSRNSFASYLYLCAAVGVGYMIGESRPSGGPGDWRQKLGRMAEVLLSPKARVRILLCIMVVALVLSRSRMGNSAFFVSLTAAGGMALFLQRRYVTRGLVILFISLILIDTLIVAKWFGIEKVVERLEQTSVERDKGRIDVSGDAWHMWQDHLWTGSGSGSFYSVFPAYKGPEIRTFEWHAHNDYLEFGAELGIIGLFILGALVLYALVTSIRVQMRRRHPLMRGMGFTCTMAIIALAMHSTVDFSLQVPAIGATILLIMTMAQIALWMPVEREIRAAPEDEEPDQLFAGDLGMFNDTETNTPVSPSAQAPSAQAPRVQAPGRHRH